LKDILDRIAPVVSGRNYRLRTCSVKVLHERYKGLCQWSPFSYNHFRKCLKREHVRKSYAFPCPHCEDLAALATIERSKAQEDTFRKCERHAEMFPIQRKAYVKQRDQLKPRELMIVMDFSKFDYVTHKFQDFIVCLYTTLGSKYYHFVGEPEEKNDCHFVFWVWNFFYESKLFQDIDKIFLWSDGGPKHFKLTGFINFLSEFVDRTEPRLTLEYHFFVSRPLSV